MKPIKGFLLMVTLGGVLLISGCYSQEEHPRDHNGLQLSKLCDGSFATVYGQELLEREDCGSGNQNIPKPRLEDEPRFASSYALCEKAVSEQNSQERFECFENQFWYAYSDGRTSVRKDGLKVMTDIIKLSEAENDGSPDYIQKLSRLYQLRGMYYMAMGIENGQLLYVLLNGFFSGKDFSRVAELEPGNFVASSFDVTMDMANLRIFGKHEESAELALQSLLTAWHAGDPDVIEPINVGSMFAVTGVTMHYPLDTGAPQLSLDASLAVDCIPEVAFCLENTKNAPFARPGLEYHLAEIYARLGMRDEYIQQLDVVSQQDRYEEWAWRDLVEMQRSNPDLLLEKFASFGTEEYSDGYATRNMGCVFCHGRI